MDDMPTQSSLRFRGDGLTLHLNRSIQTSARPESPVNSSHHPRPTARHMAKDEEFVGTSNPNRVRAQSAGSLAGVSCPALASPRQESDTSLLCLGYRGNLCGMPGCLGELPKGRLSTKSHKHGLHLSGLLMETSSAFDPRQEF